MQMIHHLFSKCANSYTLPEQKTAPWVRTCSKFLSHFVEVLVPNVFTRVIFILYLFFALHKSEDTTQSLNKIIFLEIKCSINQLDFCI